MKEKIEQSNNSNNNEQFKKFKEHFPCGEIEKIELEDIPPEVMNFLEKKSHQLVHPRDYKPRNFDELYIFRHENSDNTYIAKQQKNNAEFVYFVDMWEKERIGDAELRYDSLNKDRYFKDKPFVDLIKTKEGLDMQGIGTRRVKLMNAFSRMQYNLPLYSATLNSSPGMELWESLVKKGEAKKFKEGNKDRYVIIDK